MVNFHYKAYETIRLPQILNQSGVVKGFFLICNKKNIRRVNYKRGKTIRNNIGNYEDEGNSEIKIFCLNNDPCDCQNCDSLSITGDFRLFSNNKLRKLLRKDPNYRKLGTINFCKWLWNIRHNLYK